MEILTNDKALIRAIAWTFVNRKPEVKALLIKYGVNVTGLNNKQLFDKMIFLFQINPEFLNDFSRLMIKSGAYQNITGNYNNVTWIGKALKGIASVGKGILGLVGGGGTGSSDDNTADIIKTIAEMEAEKAKARQTTTIIILTISAVAIIGGIIAYKSFK